jgi:hypothetical protein
LPVLALLLPLQLLWLHALGFRLCRWLPQFRDWQPALSPLPPAATASSRRLYSAILSRIPFDIPSIFTRSISTCSV